MFGDKEWWKSKTLWGVFLAALIAVAEIASVFPAETLPEPLPQVLQMLALAFAAYGRLVAKRQIDTPIKPEVF